MVQTARIGAATVAAYVPYDAGYHPGPEHVAIVVLRGNRLLGTAICAWDTTPGQHRAHATRLAIDVDLAMRRAGATAYLVLGYGPQGDDRARLLTAKLTDTLGRDVHATLHVHDGVVSTFDPVPRQVVGRVSSISKLGVVGSAVPA